MTIRDMSLFISFQRYFSFDLVNVMSMSRRRVSGEPAASLALGVLDCVFNVNVAGRVSVVVSGWERVCSGTGTVRVVLMSGD